MTTQLSASCREAAQEVMKIIEHLLDKDPRKYGQESLVWTVPGICQEIQSKTGMEISGETVRRVLYHLRARRT